MFDYLRNEVIKLLNEVNKYKIAHADYMRKIDENIWATPEDKAKEAEIARRDYRSQLNSYAERMETAFEKYFEAVSGNEEKFDPLSDEYINAVNIINTVGADCDERVIEKLVKRFSNSEEALLMLEAMFNKKGMTSSAMIARDAIKKMDCFDIKYLSDKLYYYCQSDKYDRFMESTFIEQMFKDYEQEHTIV